MRSIDAAKDFKQESPRSGMGGIVEQDSVEIAPQSASFAI